MSNNAAPSTSRKPLAIKRSDAEPLTRQDIQFDLLHYIFDDQNVVFTDPYSEPSGDAPRNTLNFRDLYVNTLLFSPRSSKVLREKIADNHQFGTDLAKISLLTNVGRINTTIAFFPEVRTALRTYHPVPSLQRTDGNLQDATRIKNALKACSLLNEFKNAPSTPMEVTMKRDSGCLPSTNVVNLVFVLSRHDDMIAQEHFEPGFEFQDIFIPSDWASKDRAQAFLWLCYHYLEPVSKSNPFADEHSNQNQRKAPLVHKLTPEELAEENIDPVEEIEWGEKMSEKRRLFLRKVAQESEKAALEEGPATPVEKGSGRRSKNAKAKEPPPSDSQTAPSGVPEGSRARPAKEIRPQKSSHQRLGALRSQNPGEPYPRTTAQTPTKQRKRGARNAQPKRGDALHSPMYRESSPTLGRERTMLEHAWYIVKNTDPLIDSDEDNPDEHVRLDYIRRLQQLNRLRGKSPTPPRE